MNNNLLKMLLKSKIAKSKDKKEIIDELLSYLGKENQKALKNALDELFLMIITRKDDPNLQSLIQNKINALELNIPNLDYEMIYEKFADEALPNDKFNNIAFSFDTSDIKALEVMRKNFYWMKNEYNEKVSSELKEITQKVFNGEIPRTEMASALKEQFKGVLSANTSYFEGVSDHIISQMQNIARVNQASKYSAPYYKVVARIDSRTSECCRSMNGRIIPASHIEAQSQAIQNAKNIAEKKSAAVWRSEPFYGKILPKNFGLPPYHFRCRTELVPVWVDESEVDGIKMSNTNPLSKDEVIKHIDKTGVERVLTKDNYYGEDNHSLPLHKRASKSDIVRALNSINTVAKNAKNDYINAFSDNGYFIVFNGDEIVTCFKPNENKKKAFDYFKDVSEYDKKEVIKWKIANLL
ncbi:phage head morphogenesis protein%2C SPP1 gp7 family [Campylobacter hyointestinalis subsp. hyointestinalis]|uniref:Phage head morphogenesis protein, SPP1 gp7 family n=1 Tax=Campylobacter hyointestinalis subsp. hyointestinalis TaxID=91352 RepID=A0A0S4SC36_CAMHY|nr:hypothetical protein [Campylobacter hyointestinalis]CUU83473.1 phage head morphogenesis protein%2C SPP1 gp7 family [Campylobacter hyointestinalis subsp. hyointestinalis]